MSVQISNKKQFLFGFLLILILLSIIEISMRVYDYFIPSCQFTKSEVFDEISFELKRDICNDNNRLHWDIDPLYLIPNQHFPTININSHGFRGDEPQINPDYRIFMIGGSTTFGAGTTSDDSTIPSYLQQMVSKNFDKYKIEVINAGIVKAYSFTEKNLIKDKLLNYEPNLLIIYDGLNDIAVSYEHYEEFINYKPTDQIIKKIQRADFATLKVILNLYANYKHDVVKVIPFNSNNIEKKVTLWKDSWEDICKLQEKHGFKTLIVLQPFVGTGNKPLSVEEQKYLIHYDSNKMNQYYQLYANALNELSQNCTMTLDLRNGFDSYSETIFYDSGHVGDKGNQIIAEQIYAEILPIIKNQR